MFMVIGNYLPKVKQNNTIGIRVVWTLQDEENWNATHRFSGKIWVANINWLLLCGLFSRLDRIEKRHFSRYYRPLEYSEHQKGNLNHCGKAHQRFFYRCGHRLCTVYPLGYHLFSFGFFLLLFTFACYLLKLETGVSMSTVLVTHFWTAHSFHYTLIITNFSCCASAWESLLLSIFICRE